MSEIEHDPQFLGKYLMAGGRLQWPRPDEPSVTTPLMRLADLVVVAGVHELTAATREQRAAWGTFRQSLNAIRSEIARNGSPAATQGGRELATAGTSVGSGGNGSAKTGDGPDCSDQEDGAAVGATRPSPRWWRRLIRG